MNFLDKRNKIQVLQERANIYNAVQDDLIDQNIPEVQQQKTINHYLDQHTDTFATTNVAANTLSKTLPKPLVSTLTTSALISLGLDNYGQMTTVSQDFNKVAEDQYQMYRKLKRDGQLKEFIKPQIDQKKNDEQTQKIIFKADHLKDYEDMTHQGFSNQKSTYRDQYFNPKQPKPELKYNLVQNDLNTYFNAYIKHRETLRGVPQKKKK